LLKAVAVNRVSHIQQRQSS